MTQTVTELEETLAAAKRREAEKLGMIQELRTAASENQVQMSELNDAADQLESELKMVQDAAEDSG